MLVLPSGSKMLEILIHVMILPKELFKKNNFKNQRHVNLLSLKCKQILFSASSVFIRIPTDMQKHNSMIFHDQQCNFHDYPNLPFLPHLPHTEHKSGMQQQQQLCI